MPVATAELLFPFIDDVKSVPERKSLVADLTDQQVDNEFWDLINRQRADEESAVMSIARAYEKPRHEAGMSTGQSTTEWEPSGTREAHHEKIGRPARSGLVRAFQVAVGGVVILAPLAKSKAVTAATPPKTLASCAPIGINSDSGCVTILQSALLFRGPNGNYDPTTSGAVEGFQDNCRIKRETANGSPAAGLETVTYLQRRIDTNDPQCPSGYVRPGVWKTSAVTAEPALGGIPAPALTTTTPAERQPTPPTASPPNQQPANNGLTVEVSADVTSNEDGYIPLSFSVKGIKRSKGGDFRANFPLGATGIAITDVRTPGVTTGCEFDEVRDETGAITGIGLLIRSSSRIGDCKGRVDAWVQNGNGTLFINGKTVTVRDKRTTASTASGSEGRKGKSGAERAGEATRGALGWLSQIPTGLWETGEDAVGVARWLAGLPGDIKDFVGETGDVFTPGNTN